jgi:hypothetical protein
MLWNKAKGRTRITTVPRLCFIEFLSLMPLTPYSSWPCHPAIATRPLSRHLPLARTTIRHFPHTQYASALRDFTQGSRHRSRLKSRTVASSIPDEVALFLSIHNPSSGTRALDSTQPLRDVSARKLLAGRRERYAHSLTVICEPTVPNSGLQSLLFAQT